MSDRVVIDGVTVERDGEFVIVSVEGGEDTEREWLTASDARQLALTLMGLAGWPPCTRCGKPSVLSPEYLARRDPFLCGLCRYDALNEAE